MISFAQAHKLVLENSQDYGVEKTVLSDSMGRVLGEDIKADRDFPPFHRATKDGIALNYKAISEGRLQFQIEGIVAAGTPQTQLSQHTHCLEIMTGAVLPKNADTVVMYEDTTIKQGVVTLNKTPIKGQNIHRKGSDEKKGHIVLTKNTKITASEIGVLAAVGKAEVFVRKRPSITLVSTGNELVDVGQQPLPHQIRKSNIHTLNAALSEEGIVPQKMHLPDNREAIKEKIPLVLQQNDVLLLSGGVSKGKFDFIPETLAFLGVQQLFHGVLQRPGKPFWFGIHHQTKTVIFSFPGNPASTFANYHLYFRDWLKKSLGLPIPKFDVILNEPVEITGSLTRFLRGKLNLTDGKMSVSLVRGNGSGDLTSLTKTDGFIQLEPKESNYKIGEVVPFIPTRPLS